MGNVIDFLARSLGRTLYVRVRKNRMDFRHVETGTEIGLEAQPPFSSARLLLADLSAAARMLKVGIGKTTGKLGLAPTIVFHPMDMVDGGLSEVEEGSYLKLGYEAGAREVMVLSGAELSNSQLREIMKVRRQA